jgi:hypothetical protein
MPLISALTRDMGIHRVMSICLYIIPVYNTSPQNRDLTQGRFLGLAYDFGATVAMLSPISFL